MVAGVAGPVRAAADVAWYGLEASARRGVAWSASASRLGGVVPARNQQRPGARRATPYLALDPARAAERFCELAAALPGVAVHYAVKANPDPRLLARLHAAGCRFEPASWAEVRAAVKAGADPGTVLYTNPVKPAADIARAWRAGVWRFAADSDGELYKLAEHAPGAALLLRLDAGVGGTVGDQGKFGDPPPLAEYAAAIGEAAARLPYPVQLACEPGRAIAAPAGTMVASVIGTAWRHGTVRVSLDAGAFHGLIEALESGRELRFPVTIPAAGQRMLVPCTLTGPSCDSQDTILDQVWLPEPRAGDQVLIGNAGAYTTCYSGRSAFNGYPAPGIRIVRRSTTPRSVREHEKALA
jgi:diaminopimelate decarboxylase